MTAAVALVLAGLFGAADQYLGSFSMHPWMADVSLLSAPWLVLAFAGGSTQRAPLRAALLGLGCTYVALVAYGLMTLSPLENAHLTTTTAAGFVRSEARVIAGGVVTGPAFGWLGRRWRRDGAWAAALAAAAALCLEPVARIAAGRPIASSTVLLAEVAAGVAAGAYVATRARVASRQRY